ncbi:MAG TPA: ABC transporter permease [Bacillota bacterium]|nr:ABC transporter permease [Bacillota bacterium]
MRNYIYEILRRKDLLWYLVVSGLKAEHRNSFLGYFWWLLDPLLRVGIYYFLVVYLMDRGGNNYGGFLVIGMIGWRWIDAAIKQSSKSIQKKSHIISKVYLPKIIFPLGASITELINFGFGMSIIVLYLVVKRIWPGFSIIWLPVVMTVQYLFLLAIGMIVAFASVFVRDIDNLLTHFMRLWFYSSPVIWERGRLPARYQWIVDLNPVSAFLNGYRNIFLNAGSPSFRALGIIAVVSVIVIIVMTYYYHRNEHKIVKVL